MQGKWLPTLRLLVTKINETFGHNFKEMAVAGEVALGNLLPYVQTLVCSTYTSRGDWCYGDAFYIEQKNMYKCSLTQSVWKLLALSFSLLLDVQMSMVLTLTSMEFL